ncbi:MAG: hypothetical protein KDC26_11210 [Armatimonadetes bacterium]|nr:hypothetical protein [Armatimonadota bacterium]
MAASLVLGQGQFNDLLRPQLVQEPLRLALTPILDGVVIDQEWDVFTQTSNGPTFFQWEPGKIYWAAKATPGHDVVVSIDTAGDGWLVGTDNLEIRSRLEGEQIVTTVRQLDATDRSGPVWSSPEIIPESFFVAGKPSSQYWNLEGRFDPIQFGFEPKLDSKPGIRIDVVPTGTDLGASYIPRALSFVRLRFDNSRDLFSGLTWRPEVRNRSIARFDTVRFRFNFTRDENGPDIQSIDIAGEGYARQSLGVVSQAFPEWDRKSRALVDFVSDIKDESVGGYRILRATLLRSDGKIATIRTSIRLSELIDFDAKLPRVIRYSEEAQVVKGNINIVSQARGRVDGAFRLKIPNDWSLRKGSDTNFLIYHSRGNFNVPVEFMVPAGAIGVFPIILEADIGTQTIQKVVYLPIR